MNEKTITILCSGVAMGVYIPAILLDYQLKSRGVPTDVCVLENLMTDEKKKKVLENKRAFHQSFRLALTGQKMSRDLWPSFDLSYLDKMFERWIREKRKDFIVFSGFWMSVLKEYVKKSGFEDLSIDIVHMDADISASWKSFQEESQPYNHIWLFSWKENKLCYELPVTERPPVPYCERPTRYVIHGGGWGMGTYQSIIPELQDKGLALDIVAYELDEVVNSEGNNRYYMVDPSWSPWLKNSEGNHEFPPFGEVSVGKTPVFTNKPENHGLFDVIRLSKGIISKPGGATLVDSLSAATPIIMLDPFGDYEQKNADLWENMGFGIPINKWKESGYSVSVLEELHDNLLKTKGTLQNYVEKLIERIV